MEESDKLHVYKRMSGGERVKAHEEQREARADEVFELRQKMKKDTIVRKEIIQTRGLSENQEVIVATAKGQEEGMIDSFDENGRVWVRLADRVQGQGIYKQMNLFEPIDVEPKN